MKVTPPKTLVFKTKLTPKVLTLSVLPSACALLLFFFGLDAAQKFSPSDPARIPFAGIPLLLSLVILTVVGVTLHHFLNREIVIEEDYLVYKDDKTELHLEMSKMAYSPPGNGFLKTLMFSDGETFVQLPAMFLGDKPFAELDEAISKKRRKTRDGRDTYSL